MDAAIRLARTIIAKDTIAVNWGGRVRLVAPDGNPLSRFRACQFAPAYRASTRIYRVLLGLRSAVISEALPALSPLHRELDIRQAFPGLHPIAAIIGAAGPSQSLVVILGGERLLPEVVAKLFVKRGPNAGFEREISALKDPASGGRAPKLVRELDLDGHLGVATEFVKGRPLMVRYLGRAVEQAIRALPAPQEDQDVLPAHAHPWIQKLAASSDIDMNLVTRCLRRPYPVVRLHGDFAPWNLIVTTNGSVLAIDWEHSCRHGLPGVDLAHFAIATAHLLLRKDMRTATGLAHKFLLSQLQGDSLETWTIIYLSARATALREVQSGNRSMADYWTKVARYSHARLLARG